MPNTKKLSILIPVYNEEKTITELLKRVLTVKLPTLQKEIIIVNDGSQDKTVGSLNKFTRGSSASIKVFHHTTNKGKGAAVRTCIAKATGDIFIIQDGDLELDPNDYPKILKPLVTGKSNVVFGSRFLTNSSKVKIPQVTFFGNKFLTTLTNILFNVHLTDMSTAYKAFRKDVIKKIKLNANGFEIDAQITAKLIKNGNEITEVPIKYFPRSSQEGKKLRIRDGLVIVLTLFRESPLLDFLGKHNKVISKF